MRHHTWEVALTKQAADTTEGGLLGPAECNAMHVRSFDLGSHRLRKYILLQYIVFHLSPNIYCI
jgi:hypothetical protein